MAAACVDHFSNGRFVLGVGSSHKVQVGPEHGLEFTKPVTRLRETVEVVRRLPKDGRVSYQGEVVNIQEFDLWFQPLREESRSMWRRCVPGCWKSPVRSLKVRC